MHFVSIHLRHKLVNVVILFGRWLVLKGRSSLTNTFFSFLELFKSSKSSGLLDRVFQNQNQLYSQPVFVMV